MYPEELVLPMRKQLTDQGFSELKSIDDVDNMISNKGTTLVVVNSVCGCAAANARPGAITSLINEKKPDHLTTALQVWIVMPLKKSDIIWLHFLQAHLQ